MNAAVSRRAPEIDPCRLLPPAAAQRRLASRLGQQRQFEEVLEVSASYGVDPRLLGELYGYWQDDFELERQPLLGLPSFRFRAADYALDFVHVHSTCSTATPLLLLPGASGSLAEMGSVAQRLAGEEDAAPAFHVVCPALDTDDASRAELAARLAALMRGVGYARYVVHGSDSGSGVALELAALEPTAVAGVHATSVAAYPDEGSGALAMLDGREKSQLAALCELYERVSAELPETPLEELAFVLSQLSDSLTPALVAGWRDTLLTGLTLSWTSGDVKARARYGQLRLAPSRSSHAPLSVHCFPLDAPSLRSCVECAHRVAEWAEHETGGPRPALEQPQWLIASLRRFAARLA